MNPFSQRQVGRTDLCLPLLGLGTAPLGGWPDAVAREQGVATVKRAWDRGIRYFDTAPFYGYGKAEEFLGAVLSDKSRTEFVLSTKVGRLLEPGAMKDPFYRDANPMTPRFDFSPQGVASALAGSRERLGIANPDIALIHDPDAHIDEALAQTMPALAKRRAMGELRAIGVGINTVAPLLRFGETGSFDCFLVAGRYSLLEQTPLEDLFPLARRKGFSIIAGGVFNSGLLIDPFSPNPQYDYGPAPAPLVKWARSLAEVCGEFGVPLRAAALQFVWADPVICSVVVGARTPEEIDDCIAISTMKIPGQLWEKLKSKAMLRADAEVPTS